jgi:hypothetical protein
MSNALFVLAIFGLTTAFLMLDRNHLWADRVGAASCFLISLGVALRGGRATPRWARPVLAGAAALLGAYLLVPSGDRPGAVGYGLAVFAALVVIRLWNASWD